jgi:hypothetical protein
MVGAAVTVCGGYAEIEGGRRGGTLCRLFFCLGRPEAEYGACPRYGAGGRPWKGAPGIGMTQMNAAEGVGSRVPAVKLKAVYGGGRRHSPEGGTAVFGGGIFGDGCVVIMGMRIIVW